jgi:Holliday junction DNA helicase RuvA
MIVRIRGELAEVGTDSVVIIAGGIGYCVNVPRSVLAETPPVGAPIELVTRQIVRENEIALYGFSSPSERHLFDMLLGVSGLGPKTALGLVSALGQERLSSAVINGDAEALTSAPGVGRKLAVRICSELSDRFRQTVIERAAVAVAGDEVVEALVALGHKRADAEHAAAAARAEAGDASTAALIPIALRHASKL